MTQVTNTSKVALAGGIDQASVRRNTPKVSPIQPGLTLIVVMNDHVMLDARSAFESAALNHQDTFGPPMLPKDRLIALHSGSARSIESAVGSMQAEHIETYKARKEFQSFGAKENFDYCSDEGLCALLPLIANHKGQWITAQQTVEDSLTPLNVYVLSRIHETAKTVDATVLLFLSLKQSHDDVDLYHYYDYFEVESCEPDPGCLTAFTVQFVNIKKLHALRIGNVMGGVSWEDGKVERKYSPLVSRYLKGRVMWRMRSQGSTLDEIGKTVKLDKSNVKRQLDELPPLFKEQLKEGWLTESLEYLQLAPKSNGLANPNFDNGDDDNDDEEDDDEDEPRPR